MDTQNKVLSIVSLGPDDGRLLTLGALETMRESRHLILRTARHGAADALRAAQIDFETLDELYESCEDFDELCENAAKSVLRALDAHGEVCYAVSDPASDATVRETMRRLGTSATVRVCGGVTAESCAAAAVLPFGVNTENLMTMTALSAQELRPQADRPQVITEIDTALIASDVKLWLSDLFDDEMPVYFLRNAAEPFARAERIALCDLDRQKHYDHRTAVFIPAVSVFERQRATYEDFVQVIARLRGPGGCPWDRAQTHKTLRQYMIEEACEAAETMDGDDPMKLADELGDVLLQVVLNAQIGAEHRAFTDRDVTSFVTHKMIARHEHVFGNEKADSADAVIPVWENAKKKERGEQTALERALDVPVSLPGLMRAQKVIRRVALAQGRPLENARAAAQARDALTILETCADDTALGMALEAICALAQAHELDAETALRAATERRIDALRDEDARKR